MMDEEEYFRVIEEYFLQKRGNPMLLSPKEWVLIREWQEAGIPQEVVLRGIDRAFEKKKDVDNEITSLMYCKRIVKSEYKRHLKSMEGVAGGKPLAIEPPAQDVEQYLARLADQLAESANKASEKGNNGLAEMLQVKETALRNGILNEFRTNSSINRERVEEQLTLIEKELEQLLLQLVPASDIDRFKEDSMRELKAFEEKLEFGVYQEMLRRALIKAARKQYGIPRLSLFYMA
ncbi:MAG TPA: hypothetical protein VLH08_22365 [Acidobacteriota bacterium]|nr:hypothetical protein [Acidobacteriota bacterium]